MNDSGRPCGTVDDSEEVDPAGPLIDPLSTSVVCGIMSVCQYYLLAVI